MDKNRCSTIKIDIDDAESAETFLASTKENARQVIDKCRNIVVIGIDDDEAINVVVAVTPTKYGRIIEAMARLTGQILSK